MTESRSLLLFLALGALGGVLSVVLPYVVTHGYSGPHEYSAPLFPLLRNAWEKIQLIPTSVLLFTVGGVLGFVKPGNWMLLGVSAVLLLPIAAIVEILKDPNSHNLWPIEFLFYAVLIGVPSLFGAFLGSRIRGIKQKRAR